MIIIWVNLCSRNDLVQSDTTKSYLKSVTPVIQWNLSVTTTSMIKFITRDLFSNVF